MTIANIFALCALAVFVLSLLGIIPVASWYFGMLLIVVAGALKFLR